MPVTIQGRVYYRTLEVCNRTGISRATLLRWLKGGILEQLTRDTRGWRLFTDADLEKIRARANRVEIVRENR